MQRGVDGGGEEKWGCHTENKDLLLHGSGQKGRPEINCCGGCERELAKKGNLAVFVPNDKKDEAGGDQQKGDQYERIELRRTDYREKDTEGGETKVECFSL